MQRSWKSTWCQDRKTCKQWLAEEHWTPQCTVFSCFWVMQASSLPSAMTTTPYHTACTGKWYTLGVKDEIVNWQGFWWMMSPSGKNLTVLIDTWLDNHVRWSFQPMSTTMWYLNWLYTIVTLCSELGPSTPLIIEGSKSNRLKGFNPRMLGVLGFVVMGQVPCMNLLRGVQAVQPLQNNCASPGFLNWLGRCVKLLEAVKVHT